MELDPIFHENSDSGEAQTPPTGKGRRPSGPPDSGNCGVRE